MTEAQILVVDDEVGMVTLLRNYLTREGYEVTTAPSAEVALQMLEDHDIAVILTDLRMPGMGGMELVREIHTSRPETQVILMTAFGSIDVAVEAVKAGAYHFVTKPVKLPEVGALAHKALTDVTAMHAHLAFWGAYAMIVLGMISYCLPLLTGRKLYETGAAAFAFWISNIGMVSMTGAFAVAGVTQVYLERRVGMDFLAVQHELAIHFFGLILAASLFACGILAFVSTFMKSGLPGGEVDAPAAAEVA